MMVNLSSDEMETVESIARRKDVLVLHPKKLASIMVFLTRTIRCEEQCRSS